MTLRFDYSDPVACVGAVQWAVMHDSCPECLVPGLDWEESPADIEGYIEITISCPHCKNIRLTWGFPVGGDLP